MWRTVLVLPAEVVREAGGATARAEAVQARDRRGELRPVAVGHLGAAARTVAGGDRVADPGGPSRLRPLLDVGARDLRDVFLVRRSLSEKSFLVLHTKMLYPEHG